jgi:hypothetical protein
MSFGELVENFKDIIEEDFFKKIEDIKEKEKEEALVKKEIARIERDIVNFMRDKPNIIILGATIFVLKKRSKPEIFRKIITKLHENFTNQLCLKVTTDFANLKKCEVCFKKFKNEESKKKYQNDRADERMFVACEYTDPECVRFVIKMND